MECMPAADIRKHPAFANLFADLKPTTSGTVESTPDGARMANILYHVYGNGPKKLVLICGLGGIMTMWSRQIIAFGLRQPDKYSVLVLDNRGGGQSDIVFGWYSTSILAYDVRNVLEHLGWTDPRQLNVVGWSMGGMIAQELACMIPDRINSLMLLSTAAEVDGLVSQGVHRLTSMLNPPPELDVRLRTGSEYIYSKKWLYSPDDDGAFPLNIDRVAAQKLAKSASKQPGSGWGEIYQLWAAGMHHKTAEQLKEMADKIGRTRIIVAHGTDDNSLPFHLGQQLAASLGLISIDKETAVMGESEKAHSTWTVLPNPDGRSEILNDSTWFVVGQGHMVAVEKNQEINARISALIARAERLN